MTSKGTAIRNVRVAEPLWLAAKAKAEADGVSVSDIVRAALEAYVAGYGHLSNSQARQRTVT